MGFDRCFFTHLDGRGIRLVSAQGERVIKPQDKFIVRGEGLPVPGSKGRRGDLWVTFEVAWPTESWACRLPPEVRRDQTEQIPQTADAVQQGQSSGPVELPPGLPEMKPLPPVVETRYLVPAPRRY